MISCKLGKDGTVFVTITTSVEGEESSVETWSAPPDPQNRHYQQYLAWIKEGNTPEPADPEPEREPTRDERIISAADIRKERLAAKKAAILASGLPTATKTAMADLLDGMADIVDGLVEAIQGGKP